MISMSSIQPNISASLKLPSTFSSHKFVFKPLKSSTSFNPKTISSSSSSSSSSSNLQSPFPSGLKSSYYERNLAVFSSAAVAEPVVEEDTSVSEESTTQEKEKLGVVVKAMDRPRLVLKFVWMEKNIGLALDQKIPGHGTIPLSPYYFWPRKDAWEELKMLLESKPWISQKQMIILLNQATDIINLWQQSGGNLS